ncbi:MAG: cytochrome [Thermoleophilia bacterium]|nr:cytochrome [Thermoleophilia bacterium]
MTEPQAVGAGIRPGRRDGFPAGPDLLASARWLSRFFDDPVEWYCQLRAEYGDLVGLRVGPIVRMIICFDPDLLERMLVREPREYVKGDGLRVTRFVLGNGLITSDGELHRRHRKLAAPVFTPRNIEPFADVTVEIASDMLDTWPEEGVVEIARDCYDVSLRVAGVGLFGSDFDATEREGLHEAMRDLNAGYQLIAGPGGERAVQLRLTPTARRMHVGRDHVDGVIRALISQRREARDAAHLGDLLSRLLAARDEDDGTSFTDDEVRDEAVTMLLAGHDTTAATLGWCLALLALHPDEQRLGQAEVDEVLAGRRAGASDLRSLPRVRAIIDETLRLHPAVYSTVRDPIHEVEVGRGVTLRPGTDIVVPIGGIHRDARLWESPDSFRPARFLPGGEATAEGRHRMSYLPFGTGPRVCIGSSFALQELVLVVATVLQRFELAPTEGWQLRPHVGFIRRPDGELPLQVSRR